MGVSRCIRLQMCVCVCVCRKRLTRSDLGNAQGEDHGEVVKSVMQKGFLGRDTEQLFPYGIYTYV